MHILTPALLLSLLPSLVVADQATLKDTAAGWFDKAKSYIPNSVPSVPNPVAAGAAGIADKRVEKINIRNWERKLGPKLHGEEEWIIYLTGGNKSCFGRCGPADLAWNESVPLLTALPASTGAPPLYLGILDCDKEAVLCTAWASAVPSIYHFTFPQKTAENPTPASPLHIVPVNISSVTASDFLSIPRASKSRYATFEPYDGAVHPFDGWLAKYQLLIPLGYLLWGFGSTPSWLMMIGISFFSRQIMSRRAGARPGFGATAPAAAPQAQAQTPARPAPAAAGGARSGGKKRR